MNQANETETDGARLQKRFDALKAETGMKKAEFARLFKVPGGASMISQHISGHRPIGLDAAVAYMRGFKCSITDISPTLAAQLPESTPSTTPAPSSRVPASPSHALSIETIAQSLALMTDAQREAMAGKLAALARAPDSPTLKKSISESLGSTALPPTDST
jgi:hypothetical protein